MRHFRNHSRPLARPPAAPCAAHRMAETSRRSRLFQEWNHLAAGILEWQDLILSPMGDQDARPARPLHSRRHEARRERDHRAEQIAIGYSQSNRIGGSVRKAADRDLPRVRAAAKTLCRALGRSAARQVHSRNGSRPMWFPAMPERGAENRTLPPGRPAGERPAARPRSPHGGIAAEEPGPASTSVHKGGRPGPFATRAG